MKWKATAADGFYYKLSLAIGKSNDEELLAILNEAYQLMGIDPISADIAQFIKRKARINMILDLMRITDHCEEETDTYWVDPQGKIKVTLT